MPVVSHIWVLVPVRVLVLDSHWVTISLGLSESEPQMKEHTRIGHRLHSTYVADKQLDHPMGNKKLKLGLFQKPQLPVGGICSSWDTLADLSGRECA